MTSLRDTLGPTRARAASKWREETSGGGAAAAAGEGWVKAEEPTVEAMSGEVTRDSYSLACVTKCIWGERKGERLTEPTRES